MPGPWENSWTDENIWEGLREALGDIKWLGKFVLASRVWYTLGKRVIHWVELV